MGIVVAGIAAWGAVVTAITVIALPPAVSLIPLLLLGATFEAVFALHVGVERLGRYLQVFHDDRWERTAMEFGAPLAGTGSDPLFTVLFALAAVLNLIPVVAVGPVQIELLAIGIGHALFVARLIVARRAAGRQRAADLERFRSLRPVA